MIATQLAFLEDWYWATRTVPDLQWTPAPLLDHNQRILILPIGPADPLDTCALLFTQAIHTAQVEQMLKADFAQCRVVAVDELVKRPFPHRAAARAARLLAPIL